MKIETKEQNRIYSAISINTEENWYILCCVLILCPISLYVPYHMVQKKHGHVNKIVNPLLIILFIRLKNKKFVEESRKN